MATYKPLLPTAADKERGLTQGLLQLGQSLSASGGYSKMPTSFMSALGQGGAAFGQGYQSEIERAKKGQLQNLQYQQAQAQMEQTRMNIDAAKKQQAQEAQAQLVADRYVNSKTMGGGAAGGQMGPTVGAGAALSAMDPLQRARLQSDSVGALRADIAAKVASDAATRDFERKMQLQKTKGPTGRASSGIQLSNEYDLRVKRDGKESADKWYRKFANTPMINLGDKFVSRGDVVSGVTGPAPKINLRPGEQPAIRGAQADAVNLSGVNSAAAKAENAATGTAVGTSNMALYDTAQSALGTIDKANELITLVNTTGAITGAGADMIKGIQRVKAAFGSKEAAEKASSTEILNAMMGSDVFGMIKSLGIGARGLDTPAEREFMREVLTGTISLNKKTIIRLAEVRRDLGQRVIDKWNDKTKRGDLDRFYEATGIDKSPLRGSPSVAGNANEEDILGIFTK